MTVGNKIPCIMQLNMYADLMSFTILYTCTGVLDISLCSFLFLETELYGKTLHLQKASEIMLKTAMMACNAIYILFFF